MRLHNTGHNQRVLDPNPVPLGRLTWLHPPIGYVIRERVSPTVRSALMPARFSWNDNIHSP